MDGLKINNVLISVYISSLFKWLKVRLSPSTYERRTYFYHTGTAEEQELAINAIKGELGMANRDQGEDIRKKELDDLLLKHGFQIAVKPIIGGNSQTNKNKDLLKKNKVVYLFAIIPQSSRAEAIADLQEIIQDMKGSNCNRLYIWFIVFLNIVSVLYHAFFFKLKGYFYPEKQKIQKD